MTTSSLSLTPTTVIEEVDGDESVVSVHRFIGDVFQQIQQEPAARKRAGNTMTTAGITGGSGTAEKPNNAGAAKEDPLQKGLMLVGDVMGVPKPRSRVSQTWKRFRVWRERHRTEPEDFLNGPWC